MAWSDFFDRAFGNAVYVGRYAGQPFLDVQRWPLRDLRRYVKHLSDIIRAESASTP